MVEKVQITLKDGGIREYDYGASARDVAESLGGGIAQTTVAAEVNGKLIDLSAPFPGNCTVNLLTADTPGGLEVLRHTASHVMAQAVKRLDPKAKLAIGPSIENGFYYDFDLANAFTPDDLVKIEDEMGHIIKEDLPLERFILCREEALRYLTEREEPYKVELVRDLPKDVDISFYRQGDFVDLCAGPHLGYRTKRGLQFGKNSLYAILSIKLHGNCLFV